MFEVARYIFIRVAKRKKDLFIQLKQFGVSKTIIFYAHSYTFVIM